MATQNYDINYDDERFTNVEAEKEAALNDVNNTYNNMINQSDKFYQDQVDAAKDYANTQSQLQQENTNFTIEQIEQQKQQAEKDYTKEQKGAYADWQKQSNQYGANAEQMAANGLTNTGFSESSQVSMYNQYQTRVATARESFNQAVLNYNNSIKEAQLSNNSKLAEIAYNALQMQLELSLEGFQYKNSLLSEQIQMKQQTEDRYYSRWQDVLNQMNTENQFAESIRQYNQNYQFQKEQFTEEKRQFEQNYQLQVKQLDENIRQFDEEIARLKKKDAEEYALEIQQLELQKQKAAQEQSRWEKEYALAQREFSEKQRQFNATYSSNGDYPYGDTSGGTTIKTQYYSGEINPDTQYGTFNTKDENGVKYQPNNIGGKKLTSTKKKAGEIFGKDAVNSSGVNIANQTVWKIGDKHYIWNGSTNKYEQIAMPSSKNTKIYDQYKAFSGGAGGGRW